MNKSQNKRVTIPPYASIMSETLRNFGYTLETALSDIIDNSIAAGSTKIDLFINPAGEERRVGVLDDGSGMNMETLLDALRWGSKNPGDERAPDDLGRFGIGLKTAAFSQCRRLTIVTRKDGDTNAAVWDLDLIAEENDWIVEILDDFSELPWVDQIPDHGTLVILEKLDRFVNDDGSELGDTDLNQRISDTIDHLALVFHRLLSGEGRRKGIAMSLNYQAIKAFDPFNQNNPATWAGPEQLIPIREHTVKVQAFVLPHEKMYENSEDWRKYGTSDGYLKSQGFYVYRQRRLIIYGTWFRMALQREATRLARVRVDMPTSLDMEWKIDVKKASAQLPPVVRKELMTVMDQIVTTSRRPYTTRGLRLVDTNRLPVWIRRSVNNKISYRPNPEHPVIENFGTSLSDESKQEYLKVLEIIGGTLPMDTLSADLGGEPASIAEFDVDEEAFEHQTIETYWYLRKTRSDAEARAMMKGLDYLRFNWDRAEYILNKIYKPPSN